VTDLVEFLLARIDEDEAQARKLVRRARQNQQTLTEHLTEYLGRSVPGWHDWPEIEAAATRALAGCDAQRQLVKRVSDVAWATYAVRDTVLELLALPYAGHELYDPSWRP
jgi:hypothetical protein